MHGQNTDDGSNQISQMLPFLPLFFFIFTPRFINIQKRLNPSTSLHFVANISNIATCQFLFFLVYTSKMASCWHQIRKDLCVNLLLLLFFVLVSLICAILFLEQKKQGHAPVSQA
mmetsp:Transcript_33305/g.48887  ORF Transcript_33305/g.48887 Transcript_33305/m.48887 type:complete len:115 (-) Transcript_33305:81-425(-)